MIAFRAYASDFELHPKDGEAFAYLSPLFCALNRIDFLLRVNDPSMNQGQMMSDFDDQLEKALLARGAERFNLRLPVGVPQELDFAFAFAGRTVAVEIEKANREKILRDILKCHIYLHAGADFSIVGLPRNYSHSHGVWNLFQFGVQRFNECQTYGFGAPDKLARILLLGFSQFNAVNGEMLSRKTRQWMRETASRGTEE
jgi:hypothetical protein